MPNYSIQIIKAGYSPAPGPKIFWMDWWGKNGILQEYVWKITGEGHTFLLDCGIDDVEFFNQTNLYPNWPGSLNNQTPPPPPETRAVFWQVPEEQQMPDILPNYGTNTEAIEKLFITHFHYDHCSNLPAFKNAEIYVNEREWKEVTAPPNRKYFPLIVFPKHIFAYIVDEAYARTHLVRGDGEDEEVAPGIRAFRVGAHTPGTQAFEVDTAKGKVVHCSDAVFWYEHIENDVPVGFSYNVYECWEAMDRIRKRADVIIPSHDPKTMDMYENGNVV